MTFKDIAIYGGITGVVLFLIGLALWQWGITKFFSKHWNSLKRKDEIETLKDILWANKDLSKLKGDEKVTALLKFPEFNKANIDSVEQAEKEIILETPFRNLKEWLLKAGVNAQNGLIKRLVGYSLNKSNPMVLDLIAHNWSPKIIKGAIKLNEKELKNGRTRQTNIRSIPSVARAIEQESTSPSTATTNTGANQTISNNGIVGNAESRSVPSGIIKDIGTSQLNPTRKSKYFD